MVARLMWNALRGQDDRADGMFSYIRLEERVPQDHPLRALRAVTDKILAELSGQFDCLYSAMGRSVVGWFRFTGSNAKRKQPSAGNVRPGREITNRGPPAPLGHGLPVDTVPPGQNPQTHFTIRYCSAITCRAPDGLPQSSWPLAGIFILWMKIWPGSYRADPVP